ncbi:imidazole glycerol phosphate synthase subunit HisH [Flaviaesturariibacter amylovorans]|uniref:Imidazole glycerol phosphate synthase subunit HisH n=1 Tax=Flaviaesturariibacter amylovorans TaxID=1084520 RepID=A0ABP8GDZ9_9BACT
MKLAIIKYNAGNIRSVLNALERLGAEAEVTDEPEALRRADKVIFPGVGEASTAMASLRQNGLDGVLRSLTQPVLGICVGMQLLCAHSEENDTEALGIVPVRVRRFLPADALLKVPQVGWNRLFNLRSPLFAGIDEGSYVYNVHSYYAEDSPYTIAHCEYGLTYAAAVHKDNFYGVQFHTEKSAATGDRIIQNFLQL